MSDQLVYSAAEAADVLRVSKWQLYRWVDEGVLARIPHTGRRVLIARVELERFAGAGLKAAS